MSNTDCGLLPVVAEGGRLVGLITDRDICMAAAIPSGEGHAALAKLRS
ncbi:MAG TPA: CBS domain-containing protein [Pyrinomonadaceae bacterium]|jgi:CBS domain-containing protein